MNKISSNNNSDLKEESNLTPRPESKNESYRGANKLQNKVAIITGGDSGIGKAVAIAFAKEGADIVIIYRSHEHDAELTKIEVENEGKRCLLYKGDIGDKNFCTITVDDIAKRMGHINILVNNAGEQHPQREIEDITDEQLERTFRTNIFSMFFMTQAVIKHMRPGSVIINTASVTAYRGSPELLDYSSTKGAIVSFTRSLALNLVKKEIRVNGVAPGPIWTPLIPSTFPDDKVKNFGNDTPMQRAGQPKEVAPAYVFLASDDSSYIAGQMIHINGGEVING